MPRGLLALAFILGLSPPLLASTCPPIERRAGPPVYALLYGYPYGPPSQLEPLSMVDHDLVNMTWFFRSLGLRGLRVHGESSPLLKHRLGTPLYPATWRALLGSVEAIAGHIRSHPMPSPDGRRPQVYVYFVGHGLVGARDRLELFARPDGDGPGYDGELDSKLIAEHIVRPLAALADVHLIADTCYGYHLIQTRTAAYSRDKRGPRPPLDMAYTHDFADAFPGVGALLATRALTQEHLDYGGLFSHLVRSLAIGMADVDRDGVITYGEMAHALPQAVPDIDEAPDPQVVPPRLDARRPFIDWRSTPAARTCFPGDFAGKYILIDPPRIYATVNLPGEARTIWLPPGRTLGLDTWEADARYFVAEDGPVTFGAPPPHLDPLRSAMPPGTVLETTVETNEKPDTARAAGGWEPLPTMLANEPAPPTEALPPVEFVMPWSVGGTLLGGVSLADTHHANDPGLTPHLGLAGRLGYARHQWHLEAAYAWSSAYAGSADARDSPGPLTGHRLGGRTGYSYLVVAEEQEVGLGVFGGLHHLWGEGGLEPARFYVSEVALRGSLALPFDGWSRWALRLDGELGAAHAGEWIGPTARLSVGIDFEAMIP